MKILDRLLLRNKPVETKTKDSAANELGNDVLVSKKKLEELKKDQDEYKLLAATITTFMEKLTEKRDLIKKSADTAPTEMTKFLAIGTALGLNTAGILLGQITTQSIEIGIEKGILAKEMIAEAFERAGKENPFENIVTDDSLEKMWNKGGKS